jgi:UDP-GlcNAc:undecaprenyl-phosphate GlcNAc-1-phosphate transferase
MSITPDVFLVILLSLLITFACVPLAIWLARRFGLIDYPGTAPHKRHARPTPMAGGIVLILALVLSGQAFRIWQVSTLVAIFVAGLVVFAFGLWDDFRDITPIPKLLGQILAAVILIRWGVWVQIFESPEFFINLTPLVARWLDILITIIWLVGITNAFNFIDSMDGLAVGIGGVAAGFFMLLTLDSGQSDLAGFSAGLAAICMGIYLFNARPAHLFLGDGGAQILGFWLAALAIAYLPQNVNQMSSWFTTILLLGVPIFDMSLVIFSRFRHKRPIYLSGRDHTYHRLRNFGFDPNRAVLLMHIVAVILGCLAIIGLYQPPLIANLIFGIVVLCGLGILIFFEINLSRSQNQSEKNIE